MPMIVTQDDVLDHILLVKFIGNWTWEDYYKATDDVALILEQYEGDFYQVLDFTETQWVPHGLPKNPIQRGKSLGTAVMTIHIGKVEYLRMLYLMTSQKFDEQAMNVVPDMEAARQRIREHHAQAGAD